MCDQCNLKKSRHWGDNSFLPGNWWEGSTSLISKFWSPSIRRIWYFKQFINCTVQESELIGWEEKISTFWYTEFSVCLQLLQSSKVSQAFLIKRLPKPEEKAQMPWAKLLPCCFSLQLNILHSWKTYKDILNVNYTFLFNFCFAIAMCTYPLMYYGSPQAGKPFPRLGGRRALSELPRLCSFQKSVCTHHCSGKNPHLSGWYL